MRKIISAFCLLFTLTSVLAAEDGQALAPVAGTPAAADFALKDMDGKTVRLSELRGKVVLVNFWATWCPPCRREMPSLERLSLKMKGRPFVVLAVNVGEEPDHVFAFTGQLDPMPTFPMLFDKDSAILRSYPVRGLPTSFVLDKQGRMAYRAVGGREFDDAVLVGQLNELISTQIIHQDAR